MDQKSEKEKEQATAATETNVAEETTNLQSETVETTEETVDATDNMAEKDPLQVLQQQYDELNDTHLRLRAEFDNYRKRTMKEKADLIKYGGEKTLTALLPVVDDFERALQNMQTSEDVAALREGIELIYQKFMKYLAEQNVKPIEVVGLPFDVETSEAVTTFPAPDPSMKGKVIDCTKTGYTLCEKVIRHAQVVVGE